MATADYVPSIREGCRWVDNQPTGAEFTDWFEKNVPLHEGLVHDRYVNGITLIPNAEKRRCTVLDNTGRRAVIEEERLVFSPYPQVETRVRYFWDWCRENDYLGEISHVVPRNQSSGLPDGVFTTTIPAATQGSPTIFLGASYQVRVWERDLRAGGKGREIMCPPLGSKQVKLMGSRGPDVNAAMRAQTGAIGRALGFAGMLVVPGAGISSAEDMLDLAVAVAITEPTLPSPAVPETALDVTGPSLEAAPAPAAPVAQGEPIEPADIVVAKLLAQLKTNEKAYGEFAGWAKERGINLETPAPAALRSLERKLREKLARASG